MWEVIFKCSVPPKGYDITWLLPAVIVNLIRAIFRYNKRMWYHAYVLQEWGKFTRATHPISTVQQEIICGKC